MEQLVLREGARGPHGKAPLAIVASGPRGEVPAGTDPGVTIVFNRPMRSVDAPDDKALPKVRIATSEGRELAGSFRWVGTRGLLFSPSAPLPGSTEFTVTVPAAAKSVDGGTLNKDYLFNFASKRAELLGVYPGARPVRENEPIFLQWSQPVEPSELLAHLELIEEDPALREGNRVAVDVTYGAPDWVGNKGFGANDLEQIYRQAGEMKEDSGRWLKLSPKRPLRADRRFHISVKSGLHSKEGPRGSDGVITRAFRTVAPLRLSNLNCARVNLGRCQAHRDLTVVLSNPVHPEELRRFLRIVGPARPAKSTSKAGVQKARIALEHALRLDPEYGDKFQITLRRGMTDVFGQKLQEDVSVDVLVEEPFVKGNGQVAVATASGSDVQASNPGGGESPDNGETLDPNTPRRARLPYELELGLTGNVLEAQVNSDGTYLPVPYRLPVSTVNVPTFGVSSRPIPEWSLPDFAFGSTQELFLPYRFYTTQVAKNQRYVEQLELSSILEGKRKGAALLSIVGLGQLESQDRLINVTDLAISAKLSRFGSVAWVTHLSSGKPVPRARVSVYERSGKVIASANADEQGLVLFSSAELRPFDKQGNIREELLLVASANDDYAYQRLSAANNITSVGDVDYAQHGQWAGLVFTERSVYRPGEKVKASGFFRRTGEKGLLLKPFFPYGYLVVDAQGETIASGEGKLDAYGAMAEEIGLSKSAALGRAQLTVRFGRASDEQFSVGLEILAYKAAEFKVSVQGPTEEVVHRNRAEFAVTSEYFVGTPVAEGRAQLYLSRQEVDFEPPNSSGYVVNDSAFLRDLRYTTNRGTAYLQESNLLDRNGRLEKSIVLDAPEQKRPEILTFEAEVQDYSAQTQSGRATVLVHPAAFYLGVKQPTKRFLAVGATLPSDVVGLSPKGQRLTQIPVKLELYRRNYTQVLEDRPTDLLHHKTHVRDEKKGECQVATFVATKGCVLRLDEAGYFILRASAADSLGNVVSSSLGVYAVNERADSVATNVDWQPQNRRELELELDQKLYKPGDVAKVLVKSPFQQSTALVTVERGGIFERRVVQLQGKMPIVEVPITDEYFPNAFVSVHLVRGRVAQLPPPGKADVGRPDYRIGYAQLLVDPESRRLKVHVDSSRKEYSPGEEVKSTLELKAADGKPVSGSVTFYVVDEGVLRLTGYKTPDPLPAFSSPRSLGVMPVESRDLLAKILAYRNGERLLPLGIETAGDKGYEGGDGGDLPGKLRSDFRTTVYFKAGKLVGDDGKAEFRFRLPDNLTSYRMMAVAAGAQERFGFGESVITASRPLMARPALPRLLRVGDQVDAKIIISTKGKTNQLVNVLFKPSGVKSVGALSRAVHLDANGQASVAFPVRAEREGDATFEFAISDGSHADRVRMTRKIEQPLRWMSASSYGSLSGSKTIRLPELSGYRQDKGALTVSLSNSPMVGVRAVFEELEDYPYGCTEQLTSRVLPLLLSGKLAEYENVRLKAGQSDTIDTILGELTKRQSSNGAIGGWQNDSEGRPWLSAYALLALETGAKAGYFVPRQVRDRTTSYLSTQLLRAVGQVSASSLLGTGHMSPDTEVSGGDNDADEERSESGSSGEQSASVGLSRVTSAETDAMRRNMAEACFVADMLARIGQLEESRLRVLVMQQSRAPLSARIALLHAMAKLRMPRQELDRLLTDIIRSVTVGPEEARVESTEPALESLLESNVRSTAMLLESVLEIDPSHPLAAKLVRGLLRMRRGSSFANTQENAWALLGLEAYRAKNQTRTANVSASVYWAGQSEGTFAFQSSAPKMEMVTIPTDKLQASRGSDLLIELSEKGSVSYAVDLRLARNVVSGQSFDEGFSVQKLARAVDPAFVSTASKTIANKNDPQAKAGQLVLVDLLLESAETREQVVLDDPLPAGLEPVDFALATTTQALSVAQTAATTETTERAQNGSYGGIRSMTGVHREVRDDRVVYFISRLTPGIYHFRYLARATSTGTFVVPPTRAECMYDSEVFGQNRATQFVVAATD